MHMSPRGQLLGLRDAAKRVGMSTETLRRLLLARAGGPPATKRPGSNRWFLWANELDAWFDSGRVNAPAADEATPTTHQTRLSKTANELSRGV
jgi:hypothetical protein